jgi:excisionase family DNA binding protein
MSKSASVEPRAYSVKEFSKFVGISERTVWNRLEDGSIRAAKLGRRILIPASELERLLSSDMYHGTQEG